MDCIPACSSRDTLKNWFFHLYKGGWIVEKSERFRKAALCLVKDLLKRSNFIVVYLSIVLAIMDLNSNHKSPVIADAAPVNNSRIGIASLLPYSPTGTTFSRKLFLTIPRMKPVILDDLQSNTWLDVMKSSSPTHKNRNKDHSTDQISNENDVLYYNWTVCYFSFPCVLSVNNTP